MIEAVSAVDAAVELGRSALAEARWAEARAHFERAGAADPESAAALDGLSEARWWLGEWHEARELRERAFVRHRAAGARREAARAAIWLANEYLIATGNRGAWNGWLERAAGLLEGLEPGVDHGWLWFSRGRRLEDPKQMEHECVRAFELARSAGDADLEIVAVSQIGRALVAQGRTAEGFARLDEAMAAINAGEQSSYFTICEACCNLLTTCEGAAEMERLVQWCRVTDEMARRLNGLSMFSNCRLNHASVLLALGRFEQAEQELRAGLEVVLRSYPAFAAALWSKLAELRVAQGRLAEAQEFLMGHEDNPVSVRPLAKLLLARGEAAQALKLLTRRLSIVSQDSVQALPLYALLVEAQLDVGDVASAAEIAQALLDLAEQTRRVAAVAAGRHALGAVALAQGDPAAWAHFEAAFQHYVALEMPFEVASARLGMAQALAATDQVNAREVARRARADFERLGAARGVARASEVLRDLGVATGPRPRSDGLLSAREAEVLDSLRLGLSNAAIGKRLFISPKTVEHHVSKILGKLGLSSRAAAAAYAAKQSVHDSDRK